MNQLLTFENVYSQKLLLRLVVTLRASSAAEASRIEMSIGIVTDTECSESDGAMRILPLT